MIIRPAAEPDIVPSALSSVNSRCCGCGGSGPEISPVPPPSPSVTRSATITPTPTASVTPTVSPSRTPNKTPTPTLSATVTPYPTNTPRPTSAPTTNNVLPFVVSDWTLDAVPNPAGRMVSMPSNTVEAIATVNSWQMSTADLPDSIEVWCNVTNVWVSLPFTGFPMTIPRTVNKGSNFLMQIRAKVGNRISSSDSKILYVEPSVSATPTTTVTPSVTRSVGVTRSATPTPGTSPTRSPVVSPTPTRSTTPSATAGTTPSATATITPTVSNSATPGVTPSNTPSGTAAVTPTNSATPSVTATITPTISNSGTPASTPDASQTATPAVTTTVSVTPSVTASTTPSLSATPSVTAGATPSPTASITPTITPTISNSGTPDVTPSNTPSGTAAVTPTNSATPSVTATITPTISNSGTPESTPDPSPSATPTITPTISLSASETPAVTPTNSVTPSVTPSTTQSLTPTPTPSPLVVAPFLSDDWTFVFEPRETLVRALIDINSWQNNLSPKPDQIIFQTVAPGVDQIWRVFDDFEANPELEWPRHMTLNSIGMDPGNTFLFRIKAVVNGVESAYSEKGGVVPPYVSPTPTVTPTNSVTPTVSNSGTPPVTPSPTASVTPEVTPSPSPTASPTPTPTPSPTATPEALVLDTSGVPLTGIVGTPYSGQLTATGGNGPYTFSIWSGILPTGLTLDGSTGAITGIPSEANAFEVGLTVSAMDASDPELLTIVISPPPSPSPTPTPSVTPTPAPEFFMTFGDDTNLTTVYTINRADDTFTQVSTGSTGDYSVLIGAGKRTMTFDNRDAYTTINNDGNDSEYGSQRWTIAPDFTLDSKVMPPPIGNGSYDALAFTEDGQMMVAGGQFVDLTDPENIKYNGVLAVLQNSSTAANNNYNTIISNINIPYPILAVDIDRNNLVYTIENLDFSESRVLRVRRLNSDGTLSGVLTQVRDGIAALDTNQITVARDGTSLLAYTFGSNSEVWPTTFTITDNNGTPELALNQVLNPTLSTYKIQTAQMAPDGSFYVVSVSNTGNASTPEQALFVYWRSGNEPGNTVNKYILSRIIDLGGVDNPGVLTTNDIKIMDDNSYIFISRSDKMIALKNTGSLEFTVLPDSSFNVMPNNLSLMRVAVAHVPKSMVITPTPTPGLVSPTPTPSATTSGIPLSLSYVGPLSGTVGNSYAGQAIGAGGYGPGTYTYRVQDGNLPNGLTINTYNGVISGTPTIADTYTFTLAVFSGYNSVTQDRTITIIPAINTVTDEGITVTNQSQIVTNGEE